MMMMKATKKEMFVNFNDTKHIYRTINPVPTLKMRNIVLFGDVCTFSNLQRPVLWEHCCQY